MRSWSYLLIALLVAGTAAAGKWPWQRRIGREVDVRHRLAHEQVTPSMWPPEPETPSPIDPHRFRNALGLLCGKMPPERLETYARLMLDEAARFEIDPFLLAALAHDRSGCRPRTPDRARGRGLTRIDIEMHAPHIRGGEYRYYRREGDGWQREVLEIGRFPFNRWKADRPGPNLYFAAAILRVFELQCGELDTAFGSAPHRHHVSHWFYGDRVKENEPEDRVLTGRRRLLSYYNESFPETAGAHRSKPLFSPLDGTPRLVIDYFGNRRGERSGPGHQGIDIVGLLGEPVRSVAPGQVVFAGVDTPGAGSSHPLSPAAAAAKKNSEMGPGGRYIAINHGDGFRSYYMHLDSYLVEDREEVTGGQIIGTLGRSGTTTSGPHLHLEFRVRKQRIDPAEPLSDVLVNPFEN